MIFEICISGALSLLIVAFFLHRASVMKRLTAMSLALVELKKQVDDLDPHADVDMEALEKAFNEGIEHIMSYGLSTAMGGNLNG